MSTHLPGRVSGIALVAVLAGLFAVFTAIPPAPPRLAAQMPSPAPSKAPAAAASKVRVEVIARGLEHPWGLQFLPDRRAIVTERPGRIRIVEADGRLSQPLAGLPAIAVNGQGGLLDIALAPDFLRSGLLYFAYAEPRGGRENGTAVARARLAGAAGAERLEDVTVVFRQEPAHRGGLHFGARLAFGRDGRLFIAVGERFEMRFAQDLARHWGKVVRIEPDGRVPPDNPFLMTPRARPEIWSYGHRNPQAAAFHPVTGALWVVEHGPRGGDEINIVERGANYGWPVIGYGVDYSGRILHEATHQDGMVQPIYHWTPSIAPSGMAFVTSTLFPEWRSSLLVGALAGQALHRLVLDGDRILAEEILLRDRGERIRDVREAPDGAIWLLTDVGEGNILRLTPAR